MPRSVFGVGSLSQACFLHLILLDLIKHPSEIQIAVHISAVYSSTVVDFYALPNAFTGK